MALDPRATHKASGAGGEATARAVAALGVYKAGVSACGPYGQATAAGRPVGRRRKRDDGHDNSQREQELLPAGPAAGHGAGPALGAPDSGTWDRGDVLGLVVARLVAASRGRCQTLQ